MQTRRNRKESSPVSKPHLRNLLLRTENLHSVNLNRYQNNYQKKITSFYCLNECRWCKQLKVLSYLSGAITIITTGLGRFCSHDESRFPCLHSDRSDTTEMSQNPRGLFIYTFLKGRRQLSRYTRWPISPFNHSRQVEQKKPSDTPATPWTDGSPNTATFHNRALSIRALYKDLAVFNLRRDMTAAASSHLLYQRRLPCRTAPQFTALSLRNNLRSLAARPGGFSVGNVKAAARWDSLNEIWVKSLQLHTLLYVQSFESGSCTPRPKYRSRCHHKSLRNSWTCLLGDIRSLYKPQNTLISRQPAKVQINR